MRDIVVLNPSGQPVPLKVDAAGNLIVVFV